MKPKQSDGTVAFLYADVEEEENIYVALLRYFKHEERCGVLVSFGIISQRSLGSVDWSSLGWIPVYLLEAK